LILPLPEAVRRYLDHFQHYFERGERNPPRDPMDATVAEEPPLIDRIKAQWLLDAPKRPENAHLFLEPLWADGHPFEPFPHQNRVVRKTVSSFPKSFLFCDEVGLGKTIEGGLALRMLMLKDNVRRALLIAPRGLIRQWMEELREKFALTVWFYDGQCLTDVAGRVRFVAEPLAEGGIVVVSRHLIARADRQAEIGAITKPWDVVIVDEAHAARQRVFGAEEPNQFLSLLQDLKRRNLFRSLWLLTATPMQIEPREVHDLMLLCGLDQPEWRPWSTLSTFEQYFRDLNAFGSVRGVRNEVIRLSRIAVANGAPDFDPRHPPPSWPAFDWENTVGQIRRGRGLGLVLQPLPGNRAEAMTPLLSRQTPLGVFTFRNTRATLRAYQERGFVQGLAVRAPWDAPVDFETEEEHDAYSRIDELCSQFYRLADVAPEERSGIGFVMAVFRKRLASSFTAFRKSLERRRDLITDIQQVLDETLAGEAFKDFAEEDEDQDGEIDARSAFDQERQRLTRLYGDPRRRGQLERERNYLNDYIRRLNQISRDSKFEVFEKRLRNLIESGHRVIVFTQYLDTLDFIRSQLEHRFGDQIGCYSGRGGEVWDPIANGWKAVEKAEIKARAKKDHATPVRILLGTDAASEGLNLQQFSALINYDLPWNPMRVEQRIGRIDRIGQLSERVLIVNLYVRHTIEEDTYETLKNRIRVFEDVVGPLQPILAEMPRILRRLARGEIELDEARRQLDEAEQRQPSVAIQPFEAYSIVDREVGDQPRSIRAPMSQRHLASWCLAHPTPGMQIVAVPEPGTIATIADGTEGCLSVIWPDAPQHLGLQAQEEMLVTFSGEVADRHPPTSANPGDQTATAELTEGVRLLTWGDPLLEAWLECLRGVPLTDADYQAAHLTRDTDPFAP
jgi:ERCC4-related helicase